MVAELLLSIGGNARLHPAGRYASIARRATRRCVNRVL